MLTNQPIRFMRQIRDDFDRLRWQGMQIKIRLYHWATNAQAEGVVGMPRWDERQVVAFRGAGHRDAYQRRGQDGVPVNRDDPIVDEEGKSIVDCEGRAIDVVMPALRMVNFSGEIADYQKLSNIAERAGRLIVKMVRLPILDNLIAWRFNDPGELWWAILFEIAWANCHPLLTAERRLWLPAEKPTSFIPYDLKQVRALVDIDIGFSDTIPKNWLKRLPDAYVSEMNDTSAASFDAADYLLAELNRTTESPKTVYETPGVEQTTDRDSKPEIKHRFAVALSFPGEHRKLVSKIANGLKDALGEHRIFYDKYHEAELACPNLDLQLQRIYKDESDLIVVFVCGEYDQKAWCGLEWRAIRSLMMDRNRSVADVMFLRLDDKPVEGLLPIDGYIDIFGKTPREITDLIIRRSTISRESILKR